MINVHDNKKYKMCIIHTLNMEHSAVRINIK